MVNCKCGATYTTVSSVEPGDRVKRTRKCVECGCVFYTIEVCLEEFERLEFRSANYKLLVSQTAREEVREIAERVLSRGR